MNPTFFMIIYYFRKKSTFYTFYLYLSSNYSFTGKCFKIKLIRFEIILIKSTLTTLSEYSCFSSIHTSKNSKTSHWVE